MSRAARLALLAIILLLVAAGSLLAGKAWLPPAALLGQGPGGWILIELRLPRLVLGLAIGALLGLSGAVLQGLLRNPLADPAILGVSSGAALGAVAAIFLGLGGSLLVSFGAAMAGAVLAMAALALLVGRGADGVTVVLAGTVLTSLAGALIAFLISIAPNPFATSEIVTWLMGALTDRGWREAGLALPFLALAAALLLTTGRALDALSLGEEAALTLGVDPRRTLALVIVALGLGIGAAVAVTGIVGFVGLIVPHLLRPLFGQRPSAILLPSLIGGAALLVAADALVRLTPGAGELRLGIVTALLGAPFFFALLLRRRGLGWS